MDKPLNFDPDKYCVVYVPPGKTELTVLTGMSEQATRDFRKWLPQHGQLVGIVTAAELVTAVRLINRAKEGS